MVKKKKINKIAIPEQAEAMRGFGSSSAASPHDDRRTRRARSRADAKKRSIEDFKEKD